MKYIFDFDDVVFNNTSMFKKVMFSLIKAEGVDLNKAKKLYKKLRAKEFSLLKFLRLLFKSRKNKDLLVQNLYKKILQDCSLFLNKEIMRMIKKAGREDCYLVTNGEKKFQRDKIKKAGVVPLFKEIHIVSDTKKEVIEKICVKNKNEKIIFIDDKSIFFKDINMRVCKNLKTVLYRRK